VPLEYSAAPPAFSTMIAAAFMQVRREWVGSGAVEVLEDVEYRPLEAVPRICAAVPE
jgi:hypothetical protein